jgi:hypothetical protein
LEKVSDCRLRPKQKWKEKDKESEECPLTSDSFLHKQLYEFTENSLVYIGHCCSLDYEYTTRKSISCSRQNLSEVSENLP